MNPELLVVVSDIHCGSDVGLAPPSTEMDSGNVVGFGKNHHQAWLWDMWLDGIERVRKITGDSPAALLVNGDATEGVHHRNNADLIAQTIENHVTMAHECLKPFTAICQTRLVVKGTECHTLNMENLLAERMGALTGKAKDKWLFRIKGCLIDAAHHMGVTSRANLEASGMSIHMGNAIMNYSRSGHEVPKVFLRGHRHCGGCYTDFRNVFGVTGAWQFLTRHGFKVVTDSIPRPNILVFDWRRKNHGELPEVHEIGFNQPQSEITNL